MIKFNNRNTRSVFFLLTLNIFHNFLSDFVVNFEQIEPEVFYEKKVFFEISQNSQENTCACNFIKKETLAQVFSREFCEISKNTFFTEHLWTTASKQINK